MAIKIKARKETPEVQPQDELRSLTERAIDAARPYLKQIAIGAGALAVVIVGLEIWGNIRDKKAGAATAELGKVLDTATASVDEAGPDLEQLQNPDPEPAKFKTFKDRSQAELAAAQALAAASVWASALASRQ